jgi:lipoate-protein ligase A
VSSVNFQINNPLRVRISPYQVFNGHINMSIDDYFARNCGEYSDIFLRFYGWKPYCVSVGYHQSIDILDRTKILNSGFNYIRRPTGGRAIFHANELTYALVVPKEKMHHRQLYMFFHIIIMRALQLLGYQVQLMRGKSQVTNIEQKAEDFPCFTRSAVSEIQYNFRKIVGSAQKIYKNAILQHGSILIGKEHEMLVDLLNEKKVMKSRMKKEMNNKTTCLFLIKKNDITPEKIMRTIVKQLEMFDNISVYFKSLEKLEIQAALADSSFSLGQKEKT